MCLALAMQRNSHHQSTVELTLRLVSESIANLRANGIAIDAGIRYVSGEHRSVKVWNHFKKRRSCNAL